MTQYVINIGALPNDGTGDPLRTAFNEVNLNFNQVWATGLVGSNIGIANNTILATNTNGNLVLATNGVGKIQAAADIVPSVSMARNLGSSTQKWNTIYSQYITISGDATVAGNLSVAGNIVQVGNIVTDALTIQLANTAASANAANGAGITVGANDAIATFLFDSGNTAWATNINLEVNGSITGTAISVSDATVYGNLNGVDGGFTGNVSANYFIGNGSLLTGLAEGYGNANAAAFLANFGSNSISTTGNITSGNLTVNSTANIDVLNVNSSGNTWTISGNILTAPSNAIWQSDPATLDEYINSAPDGYINMTSLYANANIASQLHLEHGLAQIIANDGSLSIWEFDSTGNLTLPSGGAIYSQGFTPSGNPGNTIILNPHGSGSITNQKLMIYPTAADGDHLHMTTGNLYETELFLGSDDFYIKLANTGNAVINTNDGVNQAQWNFATNGDLNLPGNTAYIGAGIDFVAIDSNSQIGLNGINIATNDITSLYNQGIISLIADYGNTSKTWTFDNTGNLVLPSNTSNINYANGVSILDGIGSNYGNSNVADFMANYGSNTISTTGTITTGNTFVNGVVSTTGNVTGANIIGYSFYANGIISASGNIDAPRFQGNVFGNTVSNITITTPDAHLQFNVGTTSNVVYINDGGMLVDGGVNGFISASGNIAGANINAIGNVTGGNIDTGGKISAVGAIFGGNAVISGNINGNSIGANTYTGGIISVAGNITGGNLSVTGNITGDTAGFAIGYRDIPQVAFTGNATIATADAGKHFYSTLSTGNVLTIANNASQGFQVGAAITIVNQGTGNITVAQGSGVTLYLAGNATSGNRIVATFGMATIMKVATDTWFINGTGVS